MWPKGTREATEPRAVLYLSSVFLQEDLKRELEERQGLQACSDARLPR